MADAEEAVPDKTELDIMCSVPEAIYFRLTSDDREVIERGKLELGMTKLEDNEVCFILINDGKASYALSDTTPILKITELNYVLPSPEEGVSFGLRLVQPQAELVELFETLLTTYSILQVKNAKMRESNSNGSTQQVVYQTIGVGLKGITGIANIGMNMVGAGVNGAVDVSGAAVNGAVGITGTAVNAAASIAATGVNTSAKLVGGVTSGLLGMASKMVPKSMGLSDEQIEKSADSFVKVVEQGTSAATQAIATGTQLASSTVKTGTDTVKKVVGKNDKPLDVPDSVKEGATTLKNVTAATANLSTAVLMASVDITKQVGEGIVSQVTESPYGKKYLKIKSGEKKKMGPKQRAAKKVAAACTKGALDITANLLIASRMLIKDVEDATIDVVDHKYGEEAASVCRETIDAYENMYVMRANYKGLSMTVLGRKLGKAAAQEFVDDVMENGLGPHKKEEAVVGAPIAEVWKTFERVGFGWNVKATKCEGDTGGDIAQDSPRVLTFEDGTQTCMIRLYDIESFVVVWELIASEPSVVYDGARYSVELAPVSDTETKITLLALYKEEAHIEADQNQDVAACMKTLVEKFGESKKETSGEEAVKSES